jgi:hypothetical protein
MKDPDGPDSGSLPGRHVSIRMPVVAAEALSDAVEGPVDDYWPESFGPHQEAHQMAVAAVERTLQGIPRELTPWRSW